MNHYHLSKADIESFLIWIPKMICESESYHSFLTKLLEGLSTLLSFEIGHYYTYVINKHCLETSNLFYFDSNTKIDTFIKHTKQTTLELGVGLSGIAWNKGKTTVLNKMTHRSKIPCLKSDEAFHISTGIAFPVFNKKKILGVFEFYSQNEFQLSDETRDICDKLAFHLSQLLTLFKENRQYKLTLNAIGEGVVGLDLEGNIIFINPTACEILGYKKDELIDKPMHSTVHYAYPNGSPYPIEASPIYLSFKMGKVHNVDDEVLWHKDGYGIPIRYNSTPIIESDVIQGTVVSFVDVSGERLAKDELKRLAHFDSLTGLLNRHGFIDALKNTLKRLGRKDESFAVIFIDLDDFKIINDSYGHSVGDRLLQQLAARFRYAVRENDTIARVGGDEFAAIIEDCNNPDYIATIAKKLMHALKGEVIIDRHSLKATISMGVAVYPFAGKSTETLLKNADTAMYGAKKLGKNQLMFYTDELNQKAQYLQRIESQLSQSINNNEFYLVYQPIYKLSNKKLEKIEALIRW